MQVNLITAIAVIGGSAAFLEVLRRWLHRCQKKRQEQLQLAVPVPRSATFFRGRWQSRRQN